MHLLASILRSVKALWPTYLVIFISAVVVAGLGLISPFLVREATDAIASAVSGEEEAGAVVHLNANYLSHLFSRSLGMTFSQYVKCKRIRYASVLLLTTDSAIDEVAYRSGFSSTSFFNHVFKEQYHMSPFAYRSRFGVARNRKGESEDPPKL